jgi:hypothetical protein
MWCSGSLPNIDLCSASLVSCWLCVPTVLTWFNLLTVCTDQASTVTCAAPSDGQEVRLPATNYLIYSVVAAWRKRKWDTTKVVKDKMSNGRKESSPQHSEPCIPRDCSSDVLYGDTLPPGVFIDAAKLCWQHRCQNMEAGRWAQGGAATSFEGSRGVGLPKVARTAR